MTLYTIPLFFVSHTKFADMLTNTAAVGNNYTLCYSTKSVILLLPRTSNLNHPWVALDILTVPEPASNIDQYHRTKSFRPAIRSCKAVLPYLRHTVLDLKLEVLLPQTLSIKASLITLRKH